MAATRVMVSTTNIGASSSSLLFKSSFFKPHSLSRLCFNNNNTIKLASKKRGFACSALYKPDIQIKEEGLPETLDYRVFFHNNSGRKVSPWHDIPLHVGDGTFNFIVEIPKESSAKMEVATDEIFTPIKQDTKKGKLRYYPYNINWNYGLLPQTWEDPSFANPDVDGAFGDNDPVDVVEIGESRGKVGQLMKIKPLGCLAMIDEGELDWKVIAISLDDPRASLVNDVDDVEKHFPGTLTAIRDWFRDYKIPDGKPANNFGLGNKAANKVVKILIFVIVAIRAWMVDVCQVFAYDCFPKCTKLSLLSLGAYKLAHVASCIGSDAGGMFSSSYGGDCISCGSDDYALKVITETNESWAKLVKRSTPAGELSLV